MAFLHYDIGGMGGQAVTATAGQEGSIGHLLRSAQRKQIKTRDRVRDLAEVYTHEREVHAMLDLMPDMFPTSDEPGNHDKTFLEPACGSGNFLEEILRRKVATVTVSPVRARWAIRAPHPALPLFDLRHRHR